MKFFRVTFTCPGKVGVDGKTGHVTFLVPDQGGFQAVESCRKVYDIPETATFHVEEVQPSEPMQIGGNIWAIHAR